MHSAGADTTNPATGSVQKPRRRVPFWDNARYACIVLVVLGHAIQRLTYDSDIALAAYLALYAFHMPAFAIISGYFSKSGSPTRVQMARVITDILLPYFIFEFLWTLTKFLVEGHADPNFTKPSWTLWFLLALGIFRLVLPYLALLRWPLLWTVIISIGVGYLPNVDSTFSLSRTLGLLPFFTLGWWLRERDIVSRLRLLDVRPWWIRLASVVVLAVAGFAAWNWIDVWKEIDLGHWLFYEDAYADLGGEQWWAGGVRIALMLLAVVLSAAFFTLIPRGTYWWTRFGQYTMYVFLLHSFVLYPFRESGVLRDLDPTWLWLPLVTLLSVALALALATKPVRWVFRPLVEPRPRWLFRDPDLAGREGHRSDPTGSRRPRPPHAPVEPRR
ncbi:fucose 4-O-acetylase-like acetyltransferase [Microbacterium phyllosphaerae]|uniref:Fucose 4-O-acetylase-like acetyltransferase n=1 Tax=Microbacterium phyllosphaerae TaxID=124798 RepID=A0ABS4WQI9_9MICO|nr:acyltransferase family protein [Microbacterium phyllosphaerae]MBP2378484.1 fucose 4-O-acetylase-like acetyltransferase [Microbacterium phyllosphaerae]MCS3441562.1 fucose 4-O-acetylase-like acetyltransferase [Microbacterium phyllosphaerae]